MRAAAGACALSVGLLVSSSSGAVAVADSTETGGGTSTESTGGSTATKTGPTTIREALATLRDAFAGDGEPKTSTSDGPITIVGNQRVDEQPVVEGTTTATEKTVTDLTNGQGPTTTLAAQTNSSPSQENQSTSTVTTGTEVTGAESTSVLSTAVVEALTPILETLAPSTQPVAAPLDPTGTPTAPTESTEPGESGAAAALAAASKSGSPTATTAPKPPASLQTAVVNPVTGAVTTLVRAFGAAGLTLVSLPFSQNPIGDVITAVQMLLTAVVNAVSEVAKVPGNLLGLLGFPDADGPTPVFGNGGSIDRAKMPVNAPVVGGEAQLPRGTTVAVNAPLFGNVVNASEFGGISPVSLNQNFATSGLAPAPASVSPATKSFLDNMVKSILVPASLTALAAIAVPGIVGLLIVCAAGIRVGYRQAKAGLALKLSGIARFAGSGPMGVVRSGSMIALHPRSSKLGKTHGTRAGRDKTASAARHLERVA